MNTDAVQTAFPPTKHGFLCKSNDSLSDLPPAEGDIEKQESPVSPPAAYLDNPAANLTNFAEEAITEFDEVAKEARKGLGEAEAHLFRFLFNISLFLLTDDPTLNFVLWQIMEMSDNQMLALEENAEANRLDIEENEETVAEFRRPYSEGQE